MFHLFFVLAVSAAPALAGSCTADNGAPCWTQAQVEAQTWKGAYSNLFAGGNPCFLNSGNKWCITSMSGNSASMNSCACDNAGSSTGAASPPAAPAETCDNSAALMSPDCSADQQKYCAINNKHSMCLYCGNNANQCGKVCSRAAITEADKKIIVDYHNKLRRKVAKGQESQGNSGAQPSAKNMYELKWNDELATVAQRWTDQCTWNHDKQRGTPTFPYVGQNMAMSMSTASGSGRNYEGKIDGWYDEVKDMASSDVAPFSDAGKTGVVGHYTQLVWGESKEIGCGFVSFYKSAEKYAYQQYLICNYGPGGNMMGMGTTMYDIGATASGCPNGDNDGLCKA